MTSQNSPRCPRCGEVDMVMKVSALYEYGFSPQVYQKLIPTPPGTDWPPFLKAETKLVQSELSKKLSPPAKPKYRFSISWGSVLIALILLIPGFIFSLFPQWLLFSLLLLAVGTIIAVWIIWHRPKDRVAHGEAVERWERAIAMWSRLYYCARDDIVFIPGQSRSVSAHSMMALLYE
jgi:hypothetical protein